MGPDYLANLNPVSWALSQACETNNFNGDYVENVSARTAIHLGQKRLARFEKPLAYNQNGTSAGLKAVNKIAEKIFSGITFRFSSIISVGCYHPEKLKIERLLKANLREKPCAYFRNSFSRSHLILILLRLFFTQFRIRGRGQYFSRPAAG